MSGGNAHSVSGNSLSLGAVFRGTLFALALTFVISVLLGLIVAVTDWHGEFALLPWISFLCVFTGSMFATKVTRRMGWMHGCLVGLCYFAVAALLFQGELTWAQVTASASIFKLFGWLAVGALGGILGVNA